MFRVFLALLWVDVGTWIVKPSNSLNFSRCKAHLQSREIAVTHHNYFQLGSGLRNTGDDLSA